MTATTTQVRGRTAARRKALARLQKLNEERERRDAQELDLATAFALGTDEVIAARAAVRAAELALGQIVDTLIGELRIRYDRAAHLLDTPEDELRRLRQVATDKPAADQAPTSPRAPARPGRRGRARPTSPTAPAPEAPDDRGGHGLPADPDAAAVP